MSEEKVTTNLKSDSIEKKDTTHLKSDSRCPELTSKLHTSKCQQLLIIEKKFNNNYEANRGEKGHYPLEK